MFFENQIFLVAPLFGALGADIFSGRRGQSPLGWGFQRRVGTPPSGRNFSKLVSSLLTRFLKKCF